MAKRNLLFVINPISGGKDKSGIEQLIKDHLDRGRYDYEIAFTTHAGHGRELSKIAVAANQDIIVAVGGDGTVNEIGGPIIHSSSTLAVLPAGSGNGFAMHLGFSRSIKKAILRLNTAKEILIDTGIVNQESFINMAGVGFASEVTHKIRNSKLRGLWAYLSLSFRQAFGYNNAEYQVVCDGLQLDGKYFLVDAANGPMFGYNFVIAPEAKLDDGLFHMVMIKDANKLRYILNLWRALANNAHKCSFIDTYTCAEIEISSKEQIYYHLDGEGQPVEGKLHFKMVPASLKVMVPQEYKSKA